MEHVTGVRVHPDAGSVKKNAVDNVDNHTPDMRWPNFMGGRNKYMALAILLVIVAVGVIVVVTFTQTTLTRPSVCVINLDRNADRLETFRKAYASSDFASWPCDRLVATDGKRVNWSRRELVHVSALPALQTVAKTGLRKGDPDLTPGAVGCYLSHVRAWKRIAASPHMWGIVFEDDSGVPAEARSALVGHLRDVPGDWDVFLMGYEDHESTRVSDSIISITSFCRLHAYAITAKAASKLSRSMLPMRQQVDWEMSNRIRLGELKVYAPSKQIAPVHWQGTDVQTPLEDK